MIGYIKLHRKFIEWEWFNIPHMVQLFIYLLLSANHKDGDWRGVKIKRGQLLTGLNRMNTDTGISIQTLRTCLSRLENTGEITSEVTNKYRVITICNYDTYQDKDTDTNKPPNKQLTSNQQTTNKQLTTNKNVKNDNNVRNIYEQWKNESSLPEYKHFVDHILNGPYDNVLKMKDQLTEEYFIKAIKKAGWSELNPQHKRKPSLELFYEKVNAMENTADLNKRFKSFYLTLLNWLKR